jgi:hypothetical protein
MRNSRRRKTRRRREAPASSRSRVSLPACHGCRRARRRRCRAAWWPEALCSPRASAERRISARRCMRCSPRSNGGRRPERRTGWRRGGQKGRMPARWRKCWRVCAHRSWPAYFAPPAAGGEVWRERAFEAVIDGVWVTGVIDRVVVERGADGRARRANGVRFQDRPRGRRAWRADARGAAACRTDRSLSARGGAAHRAGGGRGDGRGGVYGSAAKGVAALEHRESVAAVGHVVAPLQRGYVPPPPRSWRGQSSGSAFASARNGKPFRYPGRRLSRRADPKTRMRPGQKRRLKWTGQRRARSAGCPTLNFHHAVNHHGQPEEETPPEDEQAQAPEALEVAPSPEAHLAEVRRARSVRAALPSLGFYPTRRSPRRVFSLSDRHQQTGQFVDYR